jgi:acetyltransferase-like isoleucine patch superfamily enzyme
MLTTSERPELSAPGLVLGEDVEIGEGVTIGANVVIYSGTRIGDGCEIQDGAILGKSPKLARHSTAKKVAPPPLVLEQGVVVCCHAVVCAGAHIGRDSIIGDQTFIRERSRIGAGTVVGRGSTVDNDVVIGERARIQTDVYVTSNSVVENDVFIGPGVCLTNDSTMGRHDRSYPVVGPRLRRACRVGGGVVICPGLEIGEEAFIAAGAVVTKDIPPRGVAMGTPARVVREVPEGDLIEHWR